MARGEGGLLNLKTWTGRLVTHLLLSSTISIISRPPHLSCAPSQPPVTVNGRRTDDCKSFIRRMASKISLLIVSLSWSGLDCMLVLI